MVPYAELPPEQRAKDHIFTTVVRAVGTALGAPTVVRASVTVDLGPRDKEPVEQFFAYAHLPHAMQQVSKPFGKLAEHILQTLPRNAERTKSLDRLLEAKDAAVRAAIAKQV